MLTHRGLTNNARLAAASIGMRAGATIVHPMPLFHIAGCGLLTLGLVQTLGTHVLMPHFHPRLAFELTETFRSVTIGGVATMLTALLDHPGRARHDLSSLRFALGGGAPVPASLARQVEEAFGVPLVITFAQTESSCSITATRAADTAADRAETVGQPLPQTEVKIADPRTGNTVPCGTIGEICTRGYLVMQGYLGDPGATSAAIDRDGWLHTGDLGSMDERGYCRIQGRVKEMIIRGGENIYPREIEAVLLSHPGVADAAVSRRPGPVLGRGRRRRHPPGRAGAAYRRRAHRPVPRPARRLQGPGPLAVHRQLPAHCDRQDPQGRAQRAARSRRAARRHAARHAAAPDRRSVRLRSRAPDRGVHRAAATVCHGCWKDSVPATGLPRPGAPAGPPTMLSATCAMAMRSGSPRAQVTARSTTPKASTRESRPAGG